MLRLFAPLFFLVVRSSQLPPTHTHKYIQDPTERREAAELVEGGLGSNPPSSSSPNPPSTDFLPPPPPVYLLAGAELARTYPVQLGDVRCVVGFFYCDFSMRVVVFEGGWIDGWIGAPSPSVIVFSTRFSSQFIPLVSPIHLRVCNNTAWYTCIPKLPVLLQAAPPRAGRCGRLRGRGFTHVRACLPAC